MSASVATDVIAVDGVDYYASLTWPDDGEPVGGHVRIFRFDHQHLDWTLAARGVWAPGTITHVAPSWRERRLTEGVTLALADELRGRLDALETRPLEGKS